MPILVAFLLASLASAEVSLRFDPFERPDLSQAEGAGDDYGARSELVWRPVLRATLVGGAEPLANLGGTLLRLGEETHGYRLREVRPWEAVFDRNGETMVIPVEESSGR